jgi:tetratricopeptide (TPR) repeat protein
MASITAALIFGVVSFRQYKRAERAKVLADDAAKQATLARNEAEKLINFMTFDLRDKLKPIGKLDLLSEVNRRVRDYYDAFSGRDDSPEILSPRSAVLTNQGDNLKDQGDLVGALKSYRSALTIRQTLAKQAPRSPERQTNLASAEEKIGDVLDAQGDLDGSLKSYRDARAIEEQLVKRIRRIRIGSTHCL